MNNRNNLNAKIEKLRREMSKTIDSNLYNMTIDELVNKSTELNKLIVEYHRQEDKNKL